MTSIKRFILPERILCVNTKSWSSISLETREPDRISEVLLGREPLYVIGLCRVSKTEKDRKPYEKRKIQRGSIIPARRQRNYRTTSISRQSAKDHFSMESMLHAFSRNFIAQQELLSPLYGCLYINIICDIQTIYIFIYIYISQIKK